MAKKQILKGKKKTDKNFVFSVIATLFFVIVCIAVYFYKNISYSYEVLLQKANSYYIDEQYFKAAKYYAKAVDIKNANADIYRNYGMSLLKLSNYDSAVKILKISAELNPYDFETYYALGNALYMKAQKTNSAGDFIEGAKYAEKALSFSPDTEKLYLLAGLCYRCAGLQENARAWYRRALLAGNFSGAGFYNLIGHTFREEERYKEAADYYRRAISADSNFVAAYCNLGDMYLRMNDDKNALVNYEKAVQTQPSYIRAYLKIGSLYAEKENYEEAILFYKKALSIDEDGYRTNYLLGMAYKKAGRKREAVEYFRKAAERGSDEAVYELRKFLTSAGQNVL